jgi:hypothetical protein
MLVSDTPAVFASPERFRVLSLTRCTQVALARSISPRAGVTNS